MKMNVRFITTAALIAAMYTVLTLVNPFGSGAIQVRVSEALTVLPYFTPAAIPGLFIGCFISNYFAGLHILDVIFGSLATLIAAIITWRIKDKKLAPLPSVVINAVVIGTVIKFVYAPQPLPLPFYMLTVGVGQFIACYLLGYPLILALEKYGRQLFSK